MVARMPRCDRQQLQLALTDRLLPAQADDLCDHLQSCSHCRAELEQLAGDGQWWSEAKEYLSSDDVWSARSASGNCDGQSKATDAGNQFPLAEREDHISLDFLEPAPQPGLLGRLGTYEIQAVVGRGGMGIVLAARDPALDRRVAIKVLAGHLAASAAARKRFAYEAKAAAAVVHDHIIPIHSVDTSGRTPFLVMPFITGPSLQERLDQRGSLDTREVLRIAMQTAEGLAAAHAQGLVHRDIKPANILLENGCERVRITDFGLARAVDDASQTQSGFIAGTPQYMAPEQARGEPIDARADLFSLGSVMYAMCTGRPPFRAETTLAVLRRICDDPPRSVREINPDVPPWLAEIIERLLAKSPAARFQSAAELADLLRQWLAHLAQPTVILPPRFIAPAKKGSRRATASLTWTAAIGVAGLGVIASVIGMIASYAYLGNQVRESPAASPPANASRPAAARTYLATDAGRSPSAVSPDSRDLLERDFASELMQASHETAQLEATQQNRATDGLSLGDELAALALQVLQLEQELSLPAGRGNGNPPAPVDAFPDGASRRPIADEPQP